MFKVLYSSLFISFITLPFFGGCNKGTSMEITDRFVFQFDERYPSCHGSTILELPNGDLLAAWYAGSREKGDDVVILGARLVSGDTIWSNYEVWADTPDKSEGNPVLFYDRNGVLWLFYQTMYGSGEGRTRQGTGWTTCKIKAKISNDFGMSWQTERTLVEEWGFLTRNKVLQLADGTILLPVHDERDWSSRILISNDDGQNWKFSERIDSGGGFHKGNIEPTIILRDDGKILCFMRSGADTNQIWKSLSSDHGEHWSEPVEIDQPNPNSACDLLKLKNGNVVLAFNNTKSNRTPLTLTISTDDGETWAALRNLEDSEGEYSYPAIIQTKDGKIHVTYTYMRNKIKHVELSECWIRGEL